MKAVKEHVAEHAAVIKAMLHDDHHRRLIHIAILVIVLLDLTATEASAADYGFLVLSLMIEVGL